MSLRRYYGNKGKNHRPVTELLNDIGQSIKLMKKIIKNIGTTSDTIEERRKFAALKTSVHEHIIEALSITNKDYENEFLLQEHVETFRKIIEIAVKQFKQYKPHNPNIYKINNNNNNNERVPLLQSNPFHNNYQKPNLPKIQLLTNENIDNIDDDTKTLEEHEEKMHYITTELTEMKDMFVDLDDIIRDQQAMVDMIEESVHTSKNDIQTGTKHIIKADNKINKIRWNKCICLIALIAIITSFFIYIYIVSRKW